MLSAMQAARAEASEMRPRGRELPKPVLAAALKLYACSCTKAAAILQQVVPFR
jgi:hypothetical protein